MQKLMILLAGLLCFSACRTKQGSGHPVTESRNETPFKGVKISGPFDARLTQGPGNTLKITADDNIINDIHTYVEDGVLYIKADNDVQLQNVDVHIEITAPEYKYVGGSAAATLSSTNMLSRDGSITVEASSAAQLKLKLSNPDVEAEASSAGEIQLTGLSKTMDAQASSGATINAQEMLAESVKAQASSGAVIKLHASVNLNAQASSGATVEYRGNPAVSKQESSGGSIKKMD